MNKLSQMITIEYDGKLYAGSVKKSNLIEKKEKTLEKVPEKVATKKHNLESIVSDYQENYQNSLLFKYVYWNITGVRAKQTSQLYLPDPTSDYRLMRWILFSDKTIEFLSNLEHEDEIRTKTKPSDFYHTDACLERVFTQSSKKNLSKIFFNTDTTHMLLEWKSEILYPISEDIIMKLKKAIPYKELVGIKLGTSKISKSDSLLDVTSPTSKTYLENVLLTFKWDKDITDMSSMEFTIMRMKIQNVCRIIRWLVVLETVTKGKIRTKLDKNIIKDTINQIIILEYMEYEGLLLNSGLNHAMCITHEFLEADVMYHSSSEEGIDLHHVAEKIYDGIVNIEDHVSKKSRLFRDNDFFPDFFSFLTEYTSFHK